MRTTYCGLVSETLMGQTVTLMGWAPSIVKDILEGVNAKFRELKTRG